MSAIVVLFRPIVGTSASTDQEFTSCYLRVGSCVREMAGTGHPQGKTGDRSFALGCFAGKVNGVQI